jgi:hypothetical protein
MKNLLIYISPEKKFNEENEVYIKIQIENSLHYWFKEDILLVTNFPYEYMGVKSLVVPDYLFSQVSRCAIKINVICYLLENKLIDDITWFHDTEAWQIAPLELMLEKELGLTDYGWSEKWNGGSMFFKTTALDIFKLWRDKINRLGVDDERALMSLTNKNYKDINSRIHRMNITYNIGKRRINENFSRADKPIKVLHFHPYRENLLKKFDSLLPDNLKKLMYEKSISFRV